MCRRPCWGTPEDIEKIMDAGYSHRLMSEFWANAKEGQIDIDFPAPAIKGYEGKKSPFWPKSDEGCTFWNEDGLCDLHDLGLKPIEGRLANCKSEDNMQGVHEEVARTWDTDKGRAVLARWVKETNVDVERNPIEDLFEGITGLKDFL